MRLLETKARLSGDDCKRCIQHPFEVPAGVAHLSGRLAFDPPGRENIQNMMTLTLLGPDGFRGARHRHGNVHAFELSTTAATPGYTAGPIQRGTWILEIDTHMITDPGVSYSLSVDGDTESGETGLAPEDPRNHRDTDAFSTGGARRRGRAWYRGDIHCHTTHSDAGWSAADLVDAARRRGYDFLSITDHNTVSHIAEARALAGEDLHIVPGFELTTYWGHALHLGDEQWVDWRVRRDDDGMAAIARTAYAEGNLFIVAHPMSPGDPECTGCRWLYDGVSPGPARVVEVWNGPWSGDSNNEEALALWYGWMNHGLRPVATAGTDAHRPAEYEGSPVFLMIDALDLDTGNIVEAVLDGRVIMTTGPELYLRALGERNVAAAEGGATDYGVSRAAAVPAVAGAAVSWRGAPAGATLRVVVDGRVAERISVQPSGELYRDIGASGWSWSVVELRNGDGSMAALTNALFRTEAP